MRRRSDAPPSRSGTRSRRSASRSRPSSGSSARSSSSDPEGAFAREALPGVRTSPESLRASRPFIEQLRLLMSPPELQGLVADLRPTVPRLHDLGTANLGLLKQNRRLSSCFNEVIVPWSKDQVQPVDPSGLYPHDPSDAQVFEQGPFGITATAVESRSGDANGQNLRVLGGTGRIPRPFQHRRPGQRRLADAAAGPRRPAGDRRVAEDAVRARRALRDAGAAQPRGPGRRKPRPRSRRCRQARSGSDALSGPGADEFREGAELTNSLSALAGLADLTDDQAQGRTKGAALLRRDRPVRRGPRALPGGEREVKRIIRDNFRDFIAVALLAVFAIGISYYILQEQRLRIPILEEKPFELKAEFETAQAVVPGQGQTVRVAGVDIGEVREVELVDGHGVITFDIERKYLPIYENATMLMRPTTGLKDMFFDLDPGSSDAGEFEEGEVIPMTNTAPDVNLDEILEALDSDTRAYLRMLLVGAGKGLEGHGQRPRRAPREPGPDQRGPREPQRGGGEAPRRPRDARPFLEPPDDARGQDGGRADPARERRADVARRGRRAGPERPALRRSSCPARWSRPRRPSATCPSSPRSSDRPSTTCARSRATSPS